MSFANQASRSRRPFATLLLIVGLLWAGVASATDVWFARLMNPANYDHMYVQQNSGEYYQLRNSGWVVEGDYYFTLKSTAAAAQAAWGAGNYIAVHRGLIDNGTHAFVPEYKFDHQYNYQELAVYEGVIGYMAKPHVAGPARPLYFLYGGPTFQTDYTQYRSSSRRHLITTSSSEAQSLLNQLWTCQYGLNGWHHFVRYQYASQCMWGKGY